MELSSTNSETAVDDVESGNFRPTIEVAVAIDEVAYLRGWTEAIQAMRAALDDSGANDSEYVEGWLDAVTLAPVDALRLAKTRSRYARGYAAGASKYDLVHRRGCDAE
jgi:hypothetical protein